MIAEDNIKITFVGDIFPGELIYTQNYGIRTQFKRHNGYPWKSRIKSITGENDLIIGNLEGPLISQENAKKTTFFGDPEFGFFLKDCGIDILNLANNHILEHGEEGLKSTVEILRKANIEVIGKLTDFNAGVCLKVIKDLKIGIAGFSNVDLNIIRNNSQFYELTEENVFNALKVMEQNKTDLKILCFHWGNEYIQVPSSGQRLLAYKFIDKGADIIIGHHPHIIQPWEIYKNGHIFYSLGNFIFDFIHSKSFGTGLVVTVEISRNGPIKISFKSVRLSYTNTITLLPSSETLKLNTKITSVYNNFKSLSLAKYNDRYNRLLRKNHLKQRLLMKIHLIKEFIIIENKDRIILAKNLISYYLDYIKQCFKRSTIF